MQHEAPTTRDPLIELGTASTATRGPMGEMIEAVGLWHKTPFDAK